MWLTVIANFIWRNGLSTQTKQISFLETLPDDAQISREERVFRFWLNSLANSSYIDNVFEDLRNGLVLLFIYDYYTWLGFMLHDNWMRSKRSKFIMLLIAILCLYKLYKYSSNPLFVPPTQKIQQSKHYKLKIYLLLSF